MMRGDTVERFLEHVIAEFGFQLQQVIAGEACGDDLFARELDRRCRKVRIFDTWEEILMGKDRCKRRASVRSKSHVYAAAVFDCAARRAWTS